MAGSMLLLNNVPLQSSQTSNRSFGIYRQHLHSASCSESHFPQAIGKKIHLKKTPFAGLSVCSYSAKPVPLVNSEDAPFVSKNLKSVKEPVLLRKSKSFEQWDSLTAKFAGSANLLFLLLQLPQIILNTQNLMTGNKSALLAVPWLGMFTGLLGNLSLLSYFIKKGEREAVGVQMLGVISTYVVISQLAIAEAMPLPHFIGTSIVVATGLSLNFMKYFNMLTPKLWNLWEDFITIAGISALPQVMWSTFVPYVPNTILPGLVAFVAAVVSVFMARTGKLSEKGVKTLRSVSAWTASLLFMWMPVAQMWTNFLNPDNIKGLSAVTMLLAMIGNGLMIPRALFTRDLMWFTGAAWACVFYGWGNLTCMYCFKSISSGFFLASTIGFLACIGTTFWRDSKAYGHNSPITSLKELVFGVPKKPHYI